MPFNAKQYNKKYYLEHRDEIRSRAKEYYEANKETINVRHREYYERNKDRLKEHAKEYWKRPEVRKRRKAYYEKNKKRLYQKHREWVAANKERSNELSRHYYARNKAKFRERHKLYAQKLKREVLTHYGGDPPKCACCGEKHLVFLTIDHIQGNGSEHRKKVCGGKGGINFYCWLRKNNYPDGFQVLCWNCNAAKSILGYCPHQEMSN